MDAFHELRVNPAALEAEVAQWNELSGPAGKARLFVKTAKQAPFAFVLLGVVALAADPNASLMRALRMASVVTVCTILLGIVLNLWLIRRAPRIDASEIIRLRRDEYDDLAGQRWVLRTIRLGVLLGLPAAFLVGGLMLRGTATDSFAPFAAMTFLWTIPLAFLLRWHRLRKLRHFFQLAS